MATADQHEQRHRRALECPICKLKYNMTDRVPSALRCLHTLCQECVGKIDKSLVDMNFCVKCPICGRVSKSDEILTNHALCDVIQEFCENCLSRGSAERCDHCDKKMCLVCKHGHARVMHGEAMASLANLEKAVQSLLEDSSHKTTSVREGMKIVHCTTEVRKAAKNRHEDVKNSELKLITEVDDIERSNARKIIEWKKNFDAKLNGFKSFVQGSRNTIKPTYAADCPIRDLKKIRDGADRLFSEVKNIATSASNLTKYTFVPNEASPDLGSLVTQTLCNDCQPTSPGHDYTFVWFKAMAGSEGSGPEQFGEAGDIAYMGEKYVVADTANHRLKVYSKSLDLLFVFGQKGDKDDQFNQPRGLCVSVAGELFVSDSGNHRIKVYSRYLQYLRKFGILGCNNNSFKFPSGLAFMNGVLLVCDRFNFRVQVLEPDGVHVRSIGSRGSKPGQFCTIPVSVAVSGVSLVFVAEEFSTTLHVFKLTGEHVRDITPCVPDLVEPIQIAAVTLGWDDNVILADRANGRLIVLSDSADVICTIGSFGDGPGELFGPVGLAVNDRNGDIVLFEGLNCRIQLLQQLKRS